MKITDVEVYVVDPTQGASTYNDEPQNVWTFVRVLTDAGVHGWGESTNFPANGSLIIADAIRHLGPGSSGRTRPTSRRCGTGSSARRRTSARAGSPPRW